jgi:LacI family transcriptional regulator
MTFHQSKERKRVLLALGAQDLRLRQGIEKFAWEHHWNLCADATRDQAVPWRWDGDGILAWLGGDETLAGFVANRGKPAVDLSFRRPYLRLPRVLEDHAQAAQLVAGHLLEGGARSFFFYSDTDHWAQEERGNAFLSALADRGHSCQWLRWTQSPLFSEAERFDPWERRLQWLASEIAQVPGPVAVFAATDNLAQEIINACDLAGLDVPGDVAVAGADNSFLAADDMDTPLTTVETNLEGVGYRAAALLQQLMQGCAAPRKPIRVPASGLILRRSSQRILDTEPERAASFLYLPANPAPNTPALTRLSTATR